MQTETAVSRQPAGFRTHDSRLEADCREGIWPAVRLDFNDGLALYGPRTCWPWAGWPTNVRDAAASATLTYFNVNRHINPTNVACRL